MLVNLKSILNDASINKYSIGSFNCYNYETIKGVIESAKELKMPAIVAFGEKYIENMEINEVAALLEVMAKDIEVPVALHLDHCKSFDVIVKAIKAGFTSVMFDGSSYSFEENMKKTKEIVAIAHAAGVSVEAELGGIAKGEFSNEEEGTQVYTNPEEAEIFVRETGVDALAVSIGTVHGMYKGEPKIDIDILKEISRRVSIPLVLHGGSGTPEETVKECIKNGICKINVNTEISMYTVDGVKELLLGGKNYHLSQISMKEVAFIKDIVKKYMTMFHNV